MPRIRCGSGGRPRRRACRCATARRGSGRTRRRTAASRRIRLVAAELDREGRAGAGRLHAASRRAPRRVTARRSSPSGATSALHSRWRAVTSAARPSGPSSCGSSPSYAAANTSPCGRHERHVAPARVGLVLVDGDLEPAGPLAPQRDAAHPRHAPQRFARALEVEREEGAGQLAADRRLELRRARPRERRRDDHLAERERVAARAPGDRAQRDQGERDRRERGGERVHRLRVIPHARPAGSRRTGRRSSSPTRARPSARGCARSCRATY